MTEKKIIISESLNNLRVLVRSFEAHFRKNMESEDINIGEIPILLSIYKDEGLNQIDLVRKFHVTEANISKTTKNLLNKGFIVKKVDVENNLIAVKGAIPGPNKGIVVIKDAVKA